MADETLGKALLELAADGTGLTGDLKTAEDKVRASADVMQGLLAAVGIGFSLKTVIDETVKAEREETLLANAVRSTGMAAGFTAQQLKAQQAVFQETTGVGDEAISAMQRTLLSFRNVHGEVFRQASQLALDFAAATGGDAAEAARKFGIALNDPVNGLGKLKLAGVAVSDTLKEQVETLARNGDLVGAQTLLLKEMSRAYSGTAEAARDTLGGALNALKENFGNLFLEQQGAGKQLREFIELVNQSLPTVANIFSAVFAAVRHQVEGVVSNLFYLGKGLNELVHGNIHDAIGAFGEIVNPIKLAASSVAAGTLAYEESAAAMARTSDAAKTLAATAPVTAGIVKQSAAEMQEALSRARLEEEAVAAVAAANAQAQFAIFLQQTQAKTAAIAEGAAVEVDGVRQKYFLMAAEADTYFAQEELKLLNSAMTFQQYNNSMVALAQVRETRMAAIQAASAAALAKQELAQRQVRLNAATQFFGDMQTVLANSLGEQNALVKANAIVLGTVQAFAAANNALATPLPWPLPQAMAAVALAAGLSNVMQMKRLETGGPMRGGETALVGEAGPELFTAPRSGFIVPNHELGGGGITVNNNISVEGMDLGSESAAERILAGIAEAARRGVESAIPAASAFADLSGQYVRRTA